MKFTFKTNKPTGPYRSFYSSYHQIKLRGKSVGSIDDKPPYKIRFQVYKKDINEDGNPNCLWKWVRLKHESASLVEAKEFVKNNSEAILNQFNIYRAD